MKGNDTGSLTRRSVLRGTVGGATAAFSLAAGTAGAAESSDFGGWLSDTDNYDGTVEDLRGQSEVTVEVGAGNGFLFGPAAVRIDPGTTVAFEWTGKGGGHNVVAEEGPADLDSGDTVDTTGVEYEYTFEETGITKYLCEPHEAVGMKGVVVVGNVRLGGGDIRPDWGGWLDDISGGYRDARGLDEVTVQVGAEDGFVFSPSGLWVDPGTTVTFEWTGKGGGHNVVGQEGPADLDSGDTVSSAGVNYEYTFEENGITKYICEPHESVGMIGAVAVGDDVPTVDVGGEDGGGDQAGDGPAFTLPGGAPGLALVFAWFGLTAAAALAVLGVELREMVSTGRTEAGEPVEPTTMDDGIVHEIGHEEFDPVGTASLIAVYFLILVALWFFMYFVEFLGNGPTVIG